MTTNISKSMKKIFIVIFGLIVLAGILLVVFNEDEKIPCSTVKDVVENAILLDKNDTYITLSGTIASQISKRRFWFEDKTGQIVIEVKNSLIPLIPMSNQIEIEIKGEVDCETSAGEGVKIEVKELNLDDDGSSAFDELNSIE